MSSAEIVDLAAVRSGFPVKPQSGIPRASEALALTVSVTPSELAAINAFAANNGLSPLDAVGRLIRMGLKFRDHLLREAEIARERREAP